MFGRVAGVSQSLRLPHSFFRRHFSDRAIYSSFPATLHYSSPSRTSALFDCEERASRLDGSLGEAVIIHKDGLVYPLIKTAMCSNGVSFWPNTYHHPAARSKEGKQAEKPFVFTIFKDLNRTLDEFYNKHALKETADDWLAKHPYKDAVAEEN
ncbi:hypothetical protein E4U61_002355 [Claviceps capensis]|nr:hypothetical protein E4U61_002355 [Claviceps capensis]